MVKWGGGGGQCYHLGTNRANPPKTPGKFSIFPVLALFFHLSLPKIWHDHHHNNYVLEIRKIGLSVDKIWSLKKHLKLGGLLLQFFNNLQKSTWRLNGCHGYQTKAILLILTFWRPSTIALTPHQV